MPWARLPHARSPPRLRAPASANVISEWNEAATNVPTQGGWIAQLRALATAHVAAFDAVNAFEKRYAFYLSEFQAPAGASPEAAAVTSMHRALAALVPDQKARFDTSLSKLLGKVPDGPGKEAGITFGRELSLRLTLRSARRTEWMAKPSTSPAQKLANGARRCRVASRWWGPMWSMSCPSRPRTSLFFR